MIETLGIINDRSPHIIADLFEIMCFFECREIARSDIETYLIRDGGQGLKDELDVENGSSSSSAEVNERFQRLSEEVFVHLSYREATFGEWYPFSVDSDVLTAKGDLSEKHRIYVSLLAYSRLRMFSRSNISLFAANFEKLSVEAVKGLFSGWQIIHFGKGGAQRAEYGNKLKSAMTKLALKMKDIPIDARIRELSERDSGDAGIDIVAMNDFGDQAPGITAYFGQCAAQQKGWPDKRFEASAASLKKYISFFHEPGVLLIIPVLHRNPDGRWVNNDAHPAILLDRLRIVKLIEERNSAEALAAALATVPAGLIESRACRS